jgi:hypothetical protein
MSARETFLARPGTHAIGRGWSQKDIRIARYAIGATLGTAIALGFGWELSFLVPVLSLSFLSSPDKPLSFKAGLIFIAVVGFSCYLAVQIGSHLIPYPALYVPFIGILLFRLFYFGQRGGSFLLVLWLLLAVTIIPLVRLLQPSIAVFVAQGLFYNVIVTVVIAWIMFALIPVRWESGQTAAAKSKPPPPSPDEAFRTAALSTVVVMPLLLLFYLFKLTGAVVLLVFVSILASNPAVLANAKVGKVMIVANVLGGIIAIVFYELLVMVPVFVFMLLLTLAIGLVLGSQVFSDKPTGSLFGSAFSTTLLVIGSVTTSDGDASSMVYMRVLQITFAVVYVVVAFDLLNRLLPRNHG